MIGFFIWLVSAVLIFFGPATAFTAGNSVPPPHQQETPPVAYRLLTPGETEIDEFALIAVNDGPVQGIDCAWGYSYLEFNISRAAHTEPERRHDDGIGDGQRRSGTLHCHSAKRLALCRQRNRLSRMGRHTILRLFLLYGCSR